MSTTVLSNLRAFVEIQLQDPFAWSSLLCEVGIARVSLIPCGTALEERVRLVAAAVGKRLGRDPREVLDAFGAFLAVKFASTDAVDAIERTARALGEGADSVRVARDGSGRLMIAHVGDPPVCRLWQGFVRGVVASQHDSLALVHRSCMDAGAGACTVEIVRVPRQSAAPRYGADDPTMLLPK